jgi:predicted GIY-YIG superfamily endonuclease
VSTPTALYRLFGDGDELLYTGISNVFGRRWHQHSKDKEWWGEVRSATLEWHETRELALAAEEAAIKAEHPKYNGTHNELAPGTAATRAAAGWRTRRLRWEAQEARRQAEEQAAGARRQAEADRIAALEAEGLRAWGLVTVAVAAEWLGESPEELAAHRKRQTGPAWIQLPHCRDGVRYDVNDLRAYRQTLRAAA